MMVRVLEKMKERKKSKIFESAEQFIKANTYEIKVFIINHVKFVKRRLIIIKNIVIMKFHG